MRQVSGQEAEALLLVQIAQHSGGIEQRLAPFGAQEAVFAWLGTIRAVEESINLPLFAGLDKVLKQASAPVAPHGNQNSRNSELIQISLSISRSSRFLCKSLMNMIFARTTETIDSTCITDISVIPASAVVLNSAP